MREDSFCACPLHAVLPMAGNHGGYGVRRSLGKLHQHPLAKFDWSAWGTDAEGMKGVAQNGENAEMG